MKIILRSDWPHERTRRAHHACFSQNRFCFAHIINGLMTNLSLFAQDDLMCPRSFFSFFFFVRYYRALDSKTRTSTRTRFYQYQVVRAREPASFWRENVIAVVILLRKFRSSGNRLSNVRRFMILRSRKDLTYFNKNNCANFSGEQNTMKFSEAKTRTKKTLASIQPSSPNKFGQ